MDKIKSKIKVAWHKVIWVFFQYLHYYRIINESFCCCFPLSFVLSQGHFRGFAAIGLYLFMSAPNSTSSMVTAVLCIDITSAIQQKVDNAILLPKAIEPYPSAHSKPLNHLRMCVRARRWLEGWYIGKTNGWTEVGVDSGKRQRGIGLLEVCKHPNK